MKTLFTIVENLQQKRFKSLEDLYDSNEFQELKEIAEKFPLIHLASLELIPHTEEVLPEIDLRVDKDEDNSYYLECCCSNCGWKGKARLTKGLKPTVSSPSTKCPDCEVQFSLNFSWLKK